MSRYHCKTGQRNSFPEPPQAIFTESGLAFPVKSPDLSYKALRFRKSLSAVFPHEASGEMPWLFRICRYLTICSIMAP